ncbi:MAG: DUF2064 domain-containing protein [Pseudomonadota bacterium]
MLNTQLILVAKKPSKGTGKQRIAADIGADNACQLAEALLDCALEDLRQWPGPVSVLIARAKDASWARQQIPRAAVATQAAGNLGDRLSAGWHALVPTDSPAMMIGSDCPELDLAYLSRCAESLTRADVVLGLAEDGGVVVMGARVDWPALHDLPWSQSNLATALRARCEAHGLTLEVHPALSDIDSASQLQPLAKMLASDVRPARQALRRRLIHLIPQHDLAMSRSTG